MKNQKRRGLLATIGAVAAAATLALSGTVAANAAPTIDPDSDTSTLTITKYDLDEEGPAGPANGLAVGSGGTDLPTGATPVRDVQFTIQRMISYQVGSGPVVSVDLNTNAGWQAAAAITFDPAENTWEAPDPDDPGNMVAIIPNFATALSPGTTNASGIATFTDIPNGLYHVEETYTPAGVTPSAPFIVALPLTNPLNHSEWMHNVYVYPKNSRVDAIKTVDDSTPFTVTDQQGITYAITANVPRNPGTTEGTFADPTGFMITDDLAAEFTPVTVTAALTPTEAGTLIPGTDYTVTPETFDAGDEIKVQFTPAGLQKLGVAAKTANAKVVVTIVVNVDPTISSSGALNVIGNVAKVYPDQASIDSPGTAGPTQRWIETEEVETKWGTATFVKENQNGDELEGAKFKVATSRANADAGIFIRSAEVTSAADGLVTIDGLRASNFANGETQKLGAESTVGDGYDVINTAYAVYWLTETKAPVDGSTAYELLAQPIPVALLADGSIHQIVQDSNGVVQYDSTGEPEFVNAASGVKVINVEANAGFTLPLTGGTGTILLTIGGLAVLAIVLVVATRRRRMADVEE